MLVNLLLFVGALATMELVAYLTHKYLMHGPLWFLHASHHVPHKNWFEWNDLFGVFFATPAIVLIYLGRYHYPPLLWIGLGITAYGFCYFGFHDIIVHRRLPLRIHPKSRYMRRIIHAHLIHHSTHERDGAVSFGFLYARSADKLKRATSS